MEKTNIRVFKISLNFLTFIIQVLMALDLSVNDNERKRCYALLSFVATRNTYL